VGEERADAGASRQDRHRNDDLVRDMTEILTSFCARLYGRRSAARKAKAAMDAAEVTA
jgi:putative resolvase